MVHSRISKRPKSRLASVEVQFAFMLVDICKTELGLGDLAQADRALAAARASAELIADMVQTRGIAPVVRTKLSKLVKTIELAERALWDAYDTIVPGAHQAAAPPAADTLVPMLVAAAAASGR